MQLQDEGVLETMTFRLAGLEYRAELRHVMSWHGLVWGRELQWVVAGAGRQWVLPGAGKPTDTIEDIRERFMWRLLPQGEAGWRPAPA